MSLLADTPYLLARLQSRHYFILLNRHSRFFSKFDYNFSIDVYDFWYTSILRGFKTIYCVKRCFEYFRGPRGGHFVLNMRFLENRQKSLIKHLKTPQNIQKWPKMTHFISL